MTALNDHIQVILAGLAATPSGSAFIVPGRKAPQTADAMAALGARKTDTHDGVAIVGTGNGCLLQPMGPLVFNADAVPAMLLVGLLAGYDMETAIHCHGPAARDDQQTMVAALRAMGAQLDVDDGASWSVSIARQPGLHPVAHNSQGWSDPVIAAIVLTALNTPGVTTLHRIPNDPASLIGVFARFGVAVDMASDGTDGWTIALTGQCVVRAPGVEIAS